MEMQLLPAWKDSLSLILPPQGVLFFLVTLKTILRTYSTWLFYFGWLVVAFVGFDFFFLSCHVPNFIFTGPFSLSLQASSWLRLGMWYGLLFTLYLAVRPSILPKSSSYFFSYGRHFFLFLCIALFYSWINYLMVFVLYGCSPVHMYELGMSFILIFFALFFLDSRGYVVDGFYAFIRAIKMLVYNFPLCFILGTIFVLLFRAMGAFELMMARTIMQTSALNVDQQLVAELVERVVYLLLLPIPVSFITNIYIKKVHEQFSLYF
jgi:hypothetical protein